MTKLITCRIGAIDYYNHDTRRVMLELPAGQSVDFKAGQYLNIVLPDKKLPFSIASSPHQKGKIELHVRPTPGSEDSAMVETLLDSASAIEIEAPLGDCFITEPPDGPLVLVAASTGITQMKSIIEFLAPQGFEQPVHLYWGVLCDKDLYLLDLCESWQQKHQTFHFVPVVSEPETSPGWRGCTGLVGDAVLEDLESFDHATAYLSGGPAMVYATLDAFVERGMPTENIFSDIFIYAPRN